VFPVMYELNFYIPEDDIIHCHRSEHLKSYTALTGCAVYRRSNVSPVRYELGCYIREDGILHSHCRENLETQYFVRFEAIFTYFVPSPSLWKTSLMSLNLHLQTISD
jgi:hypothetical protein